MRKIEPYIIIIILSVIAFFAIRGCLNEKQKNKSFRNNYAALQDSAKILKDKNGILHAQKQNLLLNQKQAQTFFSSQIDSMSKLLDVKPKHIKSIVYVPFQADINLDSLKRELASVDTIHTHSVDTTLGRVRINSIMSLTKYEKGTGFLNLKKKQYLDVHFDNPIFKPLNITGFDITEKPKRFSVGTYVGYGWNGAKWSPSVGISVQYN